VLSYIIEAGSAPGLSNLVFYVTFSTATTFTASGVPNGTYYVRVRAAASPSNISPPSNEVVVVVGPTGACAGPPQNLTVASQSAGTIALAWGAPATGSPFSYVIVAGSSPGLGNLANFNTGSANLGFVATGIPAGSYYVRVHSVSNCGTSAPSNEVLVFVVGFSGDVQVSVSWDAPSDVDLHVVDPFGEEIYYGNQTSASGGQLDVDSNPACQIDGRQIENIRWTGAAPAGTYTVRVDYYQGCGVGVTHYLVTVKNGPSVQTFTGSFTGDGDRGSVGSGVLITAFPHSAPDALRDAATKLFKAPPLFTPSPAKVRIFRGGN
jgi:predicted phage tail protein